MEISLPGALAILSAMITPAVLISACGSLIIATSNRLGRVIDRTRRISDDFRELAEEGADGALRDEERSVLFDQLDRATRRSRLLQRSMIRLYLALGAFVGTSVAIGVMALFGQHFAWLAIALGLAGAGLLFHASVLLIVESRIALGAIEGEMDFVLRLRHHHAPTELRERRRKRRFRR